MTDITPLKDQVIDALDAAGYEVAEGRADLLRVLETENLYPAFGTCFGNNPAAPYVVPAVPQAKEGEAYDYGDSMRSPNDPNLYWTYRLQEHEAIVVLGNMPPKAAFVGYETFHFTRYFDCNDPSTMNDWLTHAFGVQHHLSPTPDNLIYDNAPIANGDTYENNPNRVILFANGSTINRRTLEREVDPEFWGKQAIFSTSADADFMGVLNDHLGDLKAIHVHSHLGEDLKLGLTDRDDDFWTLMRYAVPEDDDAGNTWRNDIVNQLAVLRVTKRDTSGGVNRHPVFQFEEKVGNTDERELAADLQLVADEVSDVLNFGADAEQQVCIPLSMPLHKPTSLPMAMSAVGATNDADYRISSARPFGSGEALAIVGVNHTQTNNSTYVSLGIYDAEKWLGVKGISQALGFPASQLLFDSVEGFFNLFGGLPASLQNTDHEKLYVHVVARADAALPSNLKQSKYCTEINDADGEENYLPLASRIRISERAYLNPASSSACGPDHKKLLSNIVIAPGDGTARKRRRSRRPASK